MLLPALGLARMTAQGASCKNNLKQQGVGLIQYGTENQDYAPWGYNSTVAIGNIGVHIYPYIAGSPYPAEYRTEKKLYFRDIPVSYREIQTHVRGLFCQQLWL